MSGEQTSAVGQGFGAGRITVTADPFLSGIADTPCVRLSLADTKGGEFPAPEALEQFLAEADFRFASFRLPETAHPAIERLTAAGFRPIETLITFRHELTVLLPEMPSGIEWVESAPRDSAAAAQVAEIGRLAFHADRFHADPLVPDRVADSLKAQWSLNNLCGRALHSALALTEDGKVGGFCEIVRSGDWRAIDLIAVHPAYRRHGFASKMVAACLLRTAAECPDGTLLVGTSAANQASVNLYETMGFVEVRRDVTLHWAAGPL